MECATRSGGCMEETVKYVTPGEHSTATQHVPLPCHMVPPPFRWYITFLPSNACIAESLSFRVHNTHLDSASFRKDNPSYATELSRTRGRTHTKCRYPLCATMVDPATSSQSHVSPCVHITHHRCRRHSATRRHRVVCTAWCAMGRTSASRDVRDRGIFRSVVRCIPERGLYTKSIPPDKEARWYGLTDKVCSCICPPARAVH